MVHQKQMLDGEISQANFNNQIAAFCEGSCQLIHLTKGFATKVGTSSKSLVTDFLLLLIVLDKKLLYWWCMF